MDDTELDRALKSALSVSPSPEFVARVRQAIAESDPPPLFAAWVKPAVLVTSIVAIAALVTFKSRPVDQGDSLSMLTSNAITAIATMPTAVSSDITIRPVPGVERETARERSVPEVLISTADVLAFDEFVAGARQRRFEATFDGTPPETVRMTTELTVPPLTIEPLVEPAAVNN